MQTLRIIARRLAKMPIALAIAIILSSFLLVALCLGQFITQPVVVYFSYLYSTFGLILLCITLHRAVRAFAQQGGVLGLIPQEDQRDLIHRLLTDGEYRTVTLLWPSLAFNLIYALFKLLSGVALNSLWLMGVGAYYGVLAVMRFAIIRRYQVRGDQPDTAGDWRLYRNTAWWLMLLTWVIGGLITQMVILNRSYHYPGVFIYAFALYAFVKIITATSALLRQRRQESRLMAASRAISFAGALMSILALQTALIHQFSQDGAIFNRISISATGFVVCALLIFMSCAMLRNYRAYRAASKSD